MSNFFSFLDCYFQHSSPTASRNTLNSNYSSSTLNVKSSSGPSRIFEASDYLSKDEEANQYLQSQYYRQNSQFSSRYFPYDNLPDYYAGGNVKRLTLNAQPGTVYIYGVTYSSKAVSGPYGSIAACRNKSAVEALAISNSYASTGNTIDYEKFLSVATGYYYETDVATPEPFVIKETGASEVGKIPAMTLTRLASKIDIQWDAEDAYTAGYTDVKVTGFRYNGTVAGYLFPGLTHASAQMGYSWEFYNKSDISQRNGRTYHYTFTDGITKPDVTFNITATSAAAGQVNKNYTMSFSNPLKQAAWYKVNTTIRGFNNDGSITVSN